MADRFPLILNTSANQIQEIASGDTLDLTGSNIKGVGIITATNLSGNIIAGAGTSNIVSGILTAVAADIDDFVDVGSNIQLGNAGVITATTFKGDGDFVELDVDGHTNLDNVSVAGVSTFSNAVKLEGGLANLEVGGNTGITIKSANPRLIFTDTDHNPDFSIRGNGGQLRIVSDTTGSDRLIVDANGNFDIVKNVDVRGDLDVNGHTNLDNVSIAGVATVTGDIDVDGHTNLDNVSVSGVCTVSSNIYTNGRLEISSSQPRIHLVDTDNNDDFSIYNNHGNFLIYDSTNGADRFKIDSSGVVTIPGNTDFGAGIDVTGNATVSGNLSVGGVLTYEDVTNVDSVGLVTARNGIFIPDGQKLQLGNAAGSADFQIHHTSNNSFIKNTTGQLQIQADNLGIVNAAANSYNLYTYPNGAINLYYAGNKKFETTNTGAVVTGILTATTFVGALTGTASGNATVSANANNRIITGSGGNSLTGEANFTWDDSAGLLTVKHGYAGGGGTGLLLFDNTSTGANEGMNIEWRSGTDKTADQCRIGQFSNATGSGSNLDFYTNHQDTGSSTRRLRITHDGKLGINQLDIDADLHIATAGSSEQDGTLKVGGSENSLGLIFAYDQSGYTTTTISANPTYSSNGSILKIRTNAGDNPNQLVLKGNSAIGIGTDDPQRLLNIVTRSSTAYSTTGFSDGGTTKLRIHNVEGTDNTGTGYSAGLEFVVANGANSYGQLGYVRTGNNVGDFYFKHRTAASSYAETTRIRHNGHLVNRGPMYSIWTETVQTPNGGSQPTQFIEDCYGQWICVAKIHNVQALQGNMSSTRTINVTTADATATEWSANWGDTNPSAVRYISASDWNYWRETRVLDWMVGIPHDRLWKQYYTNGQASGMPLVASKYGWTNVGAWDGFGRWRNPGFTNWRMSDNMTGVSIADTFFTTAGQTMNLYGSANDAKFGAHWRDSTAGQDDHVSVGYGWDDGQFGRIDNFPATNNTDMSGTDKPEYGLWVFLSMDGQKHP